MKKKIVIMALLALPAFANAEMFLYKYQDNSGNFSIGTNVPAKYVKYGYKILDSKHRLLKEVEPAPTDEQKEDILSKREADKIKESIKEKISAEEVSLLKIYSNTEDIDLVKRRKVKEIEDKIKFSEDIITQMRNGKANEFRKGVMNEYSNQNHNGKITEAVVAINKQIEQVKKRIESYQEDKVDVTEEFNDIKSHYIDIKKRRA